MQTTTKVRAALIAAAVMIGVGAATTGVAFAAPAATAAAQSTPELDQMDQMMAQMVQNLPADQRDAATAMHEQMRPVMQQMMSGDMSGMDQMGSGMDGMTGGNGTPGG